MRSKVYPKPCKNTKNKLPQSTGKKRKPQRVVNLQQLRGCQVPFQQNDMGMPSTRPVTHRPHLPSVAPISTCTNLLKLRQNIIEPLKSKRLVPKNMRSQIETELLKQYDKKIKQIVTIQQWWRERRKSTKQKKYQNMIVQQLKAERHKWMLAEILLRQAKIGEKPIADVIEELQKKVGSYTIHKVSNFECNPEQIMCSQIESLCDDVKEYVKQNDQQTNTKVELQFKLYSCNAVQSKSHYSEPILKQAVEEILQHFICQFCQELLVKERQLFSRIFAIDCPSPNEPDLAPAFKSFNNQHLLALSNCFFNFIKNHYRKQFEKAMVTPYGFGPLASLRSIRGALTESQVNQMQSEQQTFSDEMLLEVSEAIHQKSLEVGGECQDDQMEIICTLANSVVGCIIEGLSNLRPYGNLGQPPLSLRTSYPARQIDNIQRRIENSLEANFCTSLLPAQQFQQRMVCAVVDEFESEWYDFQAPKFEIIYEVAADLVEGVFMEAAHDILLSFQ